MARRRKSEVKASAEKSSVKYVPVRKSNRQIAKRQSKEKKVNGDISQNSCSNSHEEGKAGEEQNQVPVKKNQNCQRKHNRHKNFVNNTAVTTKDETMCNTVSQYKRDPGESDSQDGLDMVLDQSKKMSPEDVRQVVVGNTNPEDNGTTAEPLSNQSEAWSEDVIEETIICEEMEVEEGATDTAYNLGQGGNVMVEQVYVMSEQHLGGKNFVEFTVIQNEDGTESMVMAPNSDNASNRGYHVIQEGVNNLHMNESESSVSSVCTSESNSKSSDTSCTFDKGRVNKKRSATKNDKTNQETSKQECKQPTSKAYVCSLKEDSSSVSDNSIEVNCELKSKESYRTKAQEHVSKEDVCTKIDNKLADMKINECSKEIQKLVNDLSSLESSDSLVQTSTNTGKVTPITIDDESSSSILDKMEQLHQSNNVTDAVSSITNSFQKVENSTSKDQDSCTFKSNPCDIMLECSNQITTTPSTTVQDKKNSGQAKGSDSQNVEELYVGDSEAGEDAKLCSSSENSNDTLLSTNSCKVPDVEMKPVSNQSNDNEKKAEFRNRSGSTDTTGSESGSNSSGVRRSSRIRSIGLMKQRSRGRGLVTKSNVDTSKIPIQQEREKVTNNTTSTTQEIKTDNQIENQCDKENTNKKTPSTTETVVPTTTVCSTITGYDSDSSKPVKVKSRWRRSSELEMGSSSGFGSNTTVVSTFSSFTPSTSDSGSSLTSKLNSGEVKSSESSSGYVSTITNAQAHSEAEQSGDSLINNSSNSSAITPIPKSISTKSPVPMISEVKDKEMDERLSQFEHLRENLYLTERYTNKETKRMICDCFLTEEEIERGELGCGEDCLNRLLMIECGPRCVVGDRCTNRRFQNCEYAKCEVFRTEKKGYGLRALVDLDAGEFIMEYVGEVVDPKDFRRRAKEYSKDKNKHYYFMALKSDQIIDATLKGNISRFINHSCDPNSETQKWTVNGELRIGFFNKKFIAAGEEITFDYHFQRYGKEAQKCFCEAPNCRGWIGETPEEEKEKLEKKEKREKDSKKKREEKKAPDYMEDEDLEEEIDKLCSSGLKNRAHTLTLSRLMVRSRELDHRTRLLRVIQSGEQPCRRLFLDYHGLRLIWSYVMDIATDDSENAQQFRLEVLKTLNTLPIPNKTMLMDSKIYNVVERWSRRLYLTPNDSPEDDQVKPKAISDEDSQDTNEKKSPDQINEVPDKREGGSENCLALSEIKSESTDQNVIPELASSLLSEWSNLKEVFRIPKKERIEQMKEHEREADRGYREELEKDEKRGTSYDRHRSDRYGRTEIEKRTDRRRGRESPDSEHSRSKDKRTEERSSLVPIPRMTKYERRQLFALKVAKEEEERQRRQQQESWQEHEARCLALGIDPHTTAMLDPQTGYPVFYNPSLGQWQHYSTQGGPQPVPGHSQTSVVPQSVLPPTISTEISPGISTGIPPVVYTLSQTPVFNQTTTSYPLLQQYPESQLQLPNSVVHSGTPPLQIPTPLYNHVDKSGNQQFATAESVPSRPPQPEIPLIDLPPKWKSATDARGRVYYYHVKERISQWLPPPPDHIGVQPDSSSSSESSEESSSSNEEDDDIEDEHVEEQKTEEMDLESSSVENTLSVPKHSTSKKLVHSVSGSSVLLPEAKKRRDGLVQERIISPRREEDRMDHKTYKEIKEKLRRQKERAKLKEHMEKLRKHRRSNKSKSHSRHGLSKVQSASPDASTMSERKIKDTFRINMANVMVHFLNPYRKNDCKQGRITNTEDFKHLARKLTHFVLAKELKHCKSVDELQCNENVKHKAKDFVRKYMSKFGAVYHKSTDED